MAVRHGQDLFEAIVSNVQHVGQNLVLNLLDTYQVSATLSYYAYMCRDAFFFGKHVNKGSRGTVMTRFCKKDRSGYSFQHRGAKCKQ
jgi:hypothetical protein